MRSPIPWFGGKGQIIKHLLKMVPKHVTYVEPFGGGATLLFAKEPSKVEIYNDKDYLLAMFFKVLRDRPDEFMKRIELTPYSRAEFSMSELKCGFASMVTGWDIEIACSFFVLCHQSISGMLKGWSYGITYDEVGKWRRTIDNLLPQIINRMRDVQVECLDALECIKKYDTPDTFFYIDPPYPHETRSDHRYRVEFNDIEHDMLLHLARTIKGMVLTSSYPSLFYDNHLPDWHTKEIEVYNRSVVTSRQNKAIGTGALQDKKKIEVLWWNDALNKNLAQIDWVYQQEEMKNG